MPNPNQVQLDTLTEVLRSYQVALDPTHMPESYRRTVAQSQGGGEVQLNVPRRASFPRWAVGLPALPILFRGEYPGILVTDVETSRHFLRRIGRVYSGQMHGLMIFEEGFVANGATFSGGQGTRMRDVRRGDEVALLEVDHRKVMRWVDSLDRLWFDPSTYPELYKDAGVVALATYYEALLGRSLRVSLGKLYEQVGVPSVYNFRI